MNESLAVLVRSIVAFFSLLIFTRILGKEQISQLTFFDYVLGITIGSIAGTLSTDLTSKAFPHWIGLLTWVALGFLLEIICMKSRYAAKFLEGEPTIVIMNGKIMEKALKKMQMRATDIMALLRNQGAFDLNQVEFAIMEPNGGLSVSKKAEHLPLTPKDMNIPVTSSGISTELIYDGIIIDENLRQMNKSKKWLMNELQKHGISSEKEVFFAALNSDGSLYIDEYKDKIKKVTDIGDYDGPF